MASKNPTTLDHPSQPLSTRPHFTGLDGLRGIAALAVVLFHFMEWIYTDPSQNFIGHGFLAVDFFFCLSGFVIGYAYDDRIGSMGRTSFLLARLIRLHPLVIFGSLLGFVAFWLDPFVSYASAYRPGQLAWLLVGSLLLIPLPLMKERGFNLFGFNAPSWSLFWEYIANVAYAFILCRLSRRSLLVVTALAAVGIGWVSYRSGNLLGGWSGPTFWDGGVRVAYSFSAGLLIYRSRWIIPNRLSFPGLAILLALAFLMPYFSWNWLAEALVVLVYFPLLICLGAGCRLSAGMSRLAAFLGALSYPLYMTHYWALWLFGSYYTQTKPATGELTVVIVVGMGLLIGLAYGVMVVYDTPIRRYLTRKRKA
ncbi:acyltransferase family protein [Spirosoma koreense]